MKDKMKDLIVRISGDVLESNFEDYKKDILKVIDGVNTDLKTDDDFANAESNTKKLKGAEQAIEEVKEKALAETGSVNDLLASMAEISEKIRSTRLDLEKQVKNKKAQIKLELAKRYIAETKTSIKESGTHALVISNFFIDTTTFDAAVKGKKTVSSMEKSLELCKKAILDKFDYLSVLVENNIESLATHKKEYPTSFHDYDSLVILEPEPLKLIVDSRIIAAKAEAETKAANKAKKLAETKAAEEKAKEQTEKQLDPTEESGMPDQENAKHPGMPSTTVTKTGQAAMSGHPGLDSSSPSKSTQEPPKENFVMTVEMLCQKDNAVDIAKAIDGFLKQYGDDITSINLKNL